MSRKKPKITPRKPKPAAPVMSIEDFVSGNQKVPNPPEHHNVITTKPHGSVHKLASGKELRRTTVFFQKETHKALKVFAAGEDRKISDVVEEAVRKYLSNSS